MKHRMELSQWLQISAIARKCQTVKAWNVSPEMMFPWWWVLGGFTKCWKGHGRNDHQSNAWLVQVRAKQHWLWLCTDLGLSITWCWKHSAGNHSPLTSWNKTFVERISRRQCKTTYIEMKTIQDSFRYIILYLWGDFLEIGEYIYGIYI